MTFPFQVHPANENEHFMLEALKEAWKAYKQKEVPIGAVLVKEGKIIARGFNQMEMLQDATAHAEMLCLTAGEVALENWRLSNATLYCTLEPCLMCVGAMYLTRITKLVYGAPDIRHGALGSWINVQEKPHATHHFEVERGVLKDECGELLKQFFQMRRNENGLGKNRPPFV